MSKEDIDLIWEKINCEACYNENMNYCKEKCECKCREFKALENILNQLQELGKINFRLLNNGVPKEEFNELRLKLKKEKNENEANKKKIEELEEEKCMVLQRRNGKTTKLAMQLREELLKLPTCKLYGIKNCKGKSILLTKDEVIPKAKLEEMLKTKIIDYDCEDCITGKFIEVKDIKELLKDGGE